jgi:hypothetical protein
MAGCCMQQMLTYDIDGNLLGGYFTFSWSFTMISAYELTISSAHTYIRTLLRTGLDIFCADFEMAEPLFITKRT